MQYEFFRSFDDCVTDVCDFMSIERHEFFDLAKQWTGYSSKFSTFEESEDFYRGFVGDAGRSNLCANVMDQFSRIDIGSICYRLPTASSGGRPLAFADVGCGSGALSFPHAARFHKAFLVDLPNLSQEFIKWRCQKHAISSISTGTLEEIDETISVMICIDVLEHIERSSDFFRTIDSKLAPGGIIVLRAPWHSVAPHPEHLPEAEANWHNDGGAALLIEKYQQIERLTFGGVFLKKPK